MANVKISDLTPASGVADANEFEINEAGTSKKVTGTQISSYVRGNIVTADISDVSVTATELSYVEGVTSAIQTQLDAKIDETSATGSAVLPSGTTAQRDGTPAAGYIRFNSTDGTFEGYDGVAWGAIGGVDFSSVNQSILPSVDVTYNLGSSTFKWQTGYFANISDGTTSVGTEYVVNGSAKAWSVLNGSSTLAIRDSYNISSVVDSGVGLYRGNFTSSFNNDDYAVTCGAFFAANSTSGGNDIHNGVPLTTGQYYTVNTLASTGSPRDVGTATVTVHGDLA